MAEANQIRCPLNDVLCEYFALPTVRDKESYLLVLKGMVWDLQNDLNIERDKEIVHG